MTLPVTFANLSSPVPLSSLDQDFAAVGALTIIPCGVTGTNSLSLTPAANTPTVSAYANYMQFSGIAAADNTGAVTAGVGSLAGLPVYKDTATGPAALTGAEIQAGNLITLVYDSALGAGGGFHLQTGINSSSGSYLPLGGGTLTGPLFGTSLSLSGTASVSGLTSSGAVTAVSVTGVSVSASGGMTAGSLTVGSGSTLKDFLATSIASIIFTSIAPQTSQDQTFAFASVALRDTIVMGLPSLTATGVSFNAFVSAAGTVTMRAFNITASTVTTLTLSGVRFTALQF